MRAMCGVLVNDVKRGKNLMLIMGLNETIDHLAMANCSLVWSCVEEGEWSYLMKGIGF